MKAILVGLIVIFDRYHSLVIAPSTRKPSFNSNLHSSYSSLGCANKNRDILSSSISTGSSHETTDPLSTAAKETTTSFSYQHQHCYDSLYLVSLPPPPPSVEDEAKLTESSILLSSLLISGVWKWKDQVLGDGHDFFVPRSKTLVALNQVLAKQLLLQLQQQQPSGWESSSTIPSCQVTVLSNCARCDVIVATTTATSARYDDNHDNDHHRHEASIRLSLARTLLYQVEQTKEDASRQMMNVMKSLDLLMKGGDQPNRIFCPPSNQLAPVQNDSKNLQLLANSFVVLQGPESVARYLCNIAAGLQPPNRRAWQGGKRSKAIPFRPFSSRDAHILLQLKRTADITTSGSSTISSCGNVGRSDDGDLSVSSLSATATVKDNNSASKVGVLRDLLNCALSAGKACRNVDQVPAIVALKPYGGGEASSRYGDMVGGGEAPVELTQRAIQQAQELAIEPMVQSYCNKWRAYQAANQVIALRKAVQDYLQAHNHLEVDAKLALAPVAIRELLHQPMMDLRQGKYVSTEQVLQQVSQIIMKIK